MCYSYHYAVIFSRELMNPQLSPHKLCIHCMQTLQNQHTCLHCGQDTRHYKPHPLYLKPHTLLQEQYIIGKSIGQGGFGITYIGLDIWLQKRVAIKEYMPTALATRDFISAKVLPIKQQETAFLQGLNSFLHEARNLAKFDHPNIVHVHNFFEENQTGYMVMDYLEGQSLIDLLMESNGRLTVKQTLDIMLPILDALAEVHTANIYHRDISPHNIFILTNNTPILIDFGAARHIVGENSRSLDLVLKHGYSPIEQYSGKGKIGAWTDIYACGALMYVMLVGNLPPAATDRFYDDNLTSLRDIPNANIPDSIINSIDRALNIEAKQRFQSIATFRASLFGEAIPEEIILNPETKARFSKKTVILAIILLTLFVLITQQSHFFQFNEIKRLQQQAAHYLQQQNMLLATEIYSKILNYDANNQQARQALQQIMDYYIQQVQQTLYNQQLEQAIYYIDEGLGLFPQQQNLLKLQQQVVQQQQLQALNKQITTLLQQAQQNIDNEKYQAAYVTYQSVLNLQSNQLDAIQGLQKITQYYLNQAQDDNINLQQRLEIIKKALSLFPQHNQLLSLREKLSTEQEKEFKISILLDKAQQQLQSLYLTEPNQNNAYLTYQQLLEIVPNHPQALAGFAKIADAYVKLAQSEQNLQKSLDFIKKGLQVVPNHSGLLSLQVKLEKLHVVEQNVTITPKSDILKDEITPLLNQAQQYIRRQQYELAYKTYQTILRQQENHAAALQGLQRLATIYEKLVYQYFKQQNFTQATFWVNKGLKLFPTHLTLLHLQEQLELTQQTGEVTSEVVDEKVDEEINKTIDPPVSESNIIFTPSF